jgi:hypothetical protein
MSGLSLKGKIAESKTTSIEYISKGMKFNVGVMVIRS